MLKAQGRKNLRQALVLSNGNLRPVIGSRTDHIIQHYCDHVQSIVSIAFRKLLNKADT
jgi:hypothetical protein